MKGCEPGERRPLPFVAGPNFRQVTFGDSCCPLPGIISWLPANQMWLCGTVTHLQTGSSPLPVHADELVCRLGLMARHKVIRLSSIHPLDVHF